MADRHVDVLIIGAGVSGIGVACHLTQKCPDKSVVVLEARQRIGGTWDLFRYPGMRSDTDMYTFGFGFRPWQGTAVFADAPAIRGYLEDTAAEYGVDKRIRFGATVTAASWSSASRQWTVTYDDAVAGTTCRITANVLVCGTGYYDYDAGYRPDFSGEERFRGAFVHPQDWPNDLDYTGKKVVVIGSGATAVTLVPAMAAGGAGHVTMLQRSPSYVISLPLEDAVSEALSKVLPDRAVFKLARGRNIVLIRAAYWLARKRPRAARSFVQRAVAKQLDGASDMRNFTPDYEPWDQRPCIVADNDLFREIRSGRVDVVTDTIATVTETGIELESGRHLDADVIVAATGLRVKMLGGVDVDVDGVPLRLQDKVTYKAVLIEDMPNAAMIFGYINAPWTPKVDIAADYLCRLINHLDRHGHDAFVVRADPADRATSSVLSNFTSGYVQRGDAELPRQGRRGPWRVKHDFLRDAWMLRHAAIDDGVIEFSDRRSSR